MKFAVAKILVKPTDDLRPPRPANRTVKPKSRVPGALFWRK
jgi:hypothetical protein